MTPSPWEKPCSVKSCRASGSPPPLLSLQTRTPDHGERACVLLPGSAAAVDRPGPQERPGRPRRTWRRRTEAGAGRRHPEPHTRPGLVAPVGASRRAPARASPAAGPPGAEEGPAGVPLRPVPRRSHQHPQCPHRPGQEPGHENQGCGQRSADGTHRQEEIRERGPRGPRGTSMDKVSLHRGVNFLHCVTRHLVRLLVQVKSAIMVSICPSELTFVSLLYLALNYYILHPRPRSILLNKSE